MNDTELKALKNHISRRIDELESLLNRTDQDSADSGSAANDESAAIASRITESEKQELVGLKANLRWLESADAGYCDSCGCDIPHARLMAVPVTRLCIQCAR